jgi:hypothetical protein
VGEKDIPAIMNTHRLPIRTRHRRRMLVVLAFALVALSPGTASGSIATVGYERAQVTLQGPAAGIYDYTQGLAASWSATAEFDAGTHNGTTAQDVADTLTLARIGPAGTTAPDPAIPWWDTDWNTRECFTVDHSAGTTSVTEYPVQIAWSPAPLVTAGLVQGDYGDVRVVAEDGTTTLPIWFENASTSWVQVDAIPAGGTTSFCVYYGYSAGIAAVPANHGQAPVFTYSTPKPIYYAVSAAYTGTETVAVASYVDANTIEMDGSSGTLTATIDDGDRTTFGGNTATSEYRVSGPIAARGVGDGLDTLIPVSWAGTRFVVPSNREDGVTSQVLSFFAPFGASTVTLYAGSDPVPIGTVAVAGSGGASWVETTDEVAVGETLIIEATTPVLAHHATTNGEDATALHPVRSMTWYGISSSARVGADGEDATGTATDVTITRSNTGASTTPLFRGEELVLAGSPDGGGPDDGIAVSAGGSAAGRAVGALSQDDGDGRDTVTFLPRTALADRYLIVTNSEYVAAACPTAATAFTVTDGAGSTSAFSCAGAAVGHGLLTSNLDVTATRAIEVASAGSDFFLAYEDRATNDETNILGIKHGRQYVWPAPATAASGSAEGLYVASGIWTSGTFDTGAGTEVFGEIDFLGSTTPGMTDLEIRVATSDTDPPTSFVGPDGSAISSWSLADLSSVLDFAHDGHRFVRIKVDMSTTDRVNASPRLDAVHVDHHLPLADRTSGGTASLAVVGSTTAQSAYLLRVTTDSAALAGSTAELVGITGTNLANLTPATLRFLTTIGSDVVQWSTDGTPGTPVAFSPAVGHSLVLDHTSAGPGVATIDFTWNLNVGGGASILLQSDLTVEITTP